MLPSGWRGRPSAGNADSIRMALPDRQPGAGAKVNCWKLVRKVDEVAQGRRGVSVWDNDCAPILVRSIPHRRIRQRWG